MTEFLPRSAWTDDPYPSGATMLVESEVEGIALHWPGSGGSISADRSAVIGLLRGELAFHTRPVSQGGRGWSDIAYNVAVDQAGRVWDLRGITRRSAANGDTDVNRRFVAVTCLVGAKDVPTPALLQAVRDIRAKVRARFPQAPKVVPHSAIRPDPTDCPGDRLRAHITDGTFTSNTAIEEDDMPLSDEDVTKVGGELMARLVAYFEKGPTRDLGDGTAASPILRMLNVAGRDAYWVRSVGVPAVLNALGKGVDVDEQALAAALAPLLHSDLDPAAIADQIVEALPKELAQQVLDGLAQRLAS